MSDLSLVEVNCGELLTSSQAIADGVGNQHKNVLELIRNNITHLEEFGRVAFETRTFDTAGGLQKKEVALLNEHQATFLITMLRNNTVVTKFKIRLVKEFYRMAEQLRKPQSPEEIIALGLQAANQVINKLTHKVEAALPKVAFYDDYYNADGLFTISQAAKVLEQGPQKFAALLRDKNYLFKSGNLNLPYQHWLDKGIFKMQTRNIDSKARVQTMITPKGIQYFAEKLRRKDAA